MTMPALDRATCSGIVAASASGTCTAALAIPPLKPRPRSHSVQIVSGSAGQVNQGMFLMT